MQLRLAWAGILVLAALLRLPAVSAGLSHGSHVDEEAFVMNSAAMRRAGNLDHRYHEYPGLVFYMLAPVLAPFEAGSPASYRALRMFQAVFSLASVLLTGALATAIAGRRAGLVAGALLAVAPLDLAAQNVFRPSVVLHTFVLAALLAFQRTPERLRDDLVSGAAVGAATAIKFSGVLVAAAYAAARLSARPVRWGRILAAAGASVLTFAAASPYTFLAGDNAASRIAFQVTYHYPKQGPVWTAAAHADGIAWHLATLAEGVGWVAFVLAVVGIVARRADWRVWLPHVAFVTVAVVVFSSAHVHHARFLVPCLGVVCVWAAVGIEWLAGRRREAALAAALVALGLPLYASVRFARAVPEPGSRDRAAAWAADNLPAGSRVVSTERSLRLSEQHEIRHVGPLDDVSFHLAALADVLISAEEDPYLGHLPVVQVFERNWTQPERRLLLRVPLPETKDFYSPVPVDVSGLSASRGDSLGALVDGDPSTVWTTGRGQRPEDFVEIVLRDPAPVVRVELDLGPRLRHFANDLRVRTSDDGATWTSPRYVRARPEVAEQRGKEGDAVVLEPRPIRRLRLSPGSPRERPWTIAELRVLRYDGPGVPGTPASRRQKRQKR